ncbi:MAG: c-type cytochrome [Saprospiraceae bacterium]|nr:c-type cytochrome [Saprospiraceae bacterium]
MLTDIGAMTSACGIHWYQGGDFPETYQNSIFTAEPVHNIIHVDAIHHKGATFESVELLKGSEFLASSDSWFRPVNHYTGPDGALYILDYHRKIIEHPEWLSDEVINSGDLYLGIDQGRIYRISVKGSGPMQFLDKINLEALNSDELIRMLEHKNNWWRTHAQRLLMDREDAVIIQKLKDFVLTTESTTGKVHGMWLIQGKNSMNESVILSLLNDKSAEVRENALKISEFHLSTNQNILEKLFKMVSDPSEKVRFQLLLTLGEIENKEAFEARMNLLTKDLEDPWVQYAALSAKNLDIIQLYQRSAKEFQAEETPGRKTFFRKLSETLVRSVTSHELNKFLSDILQSSKLHWFDPLVLEGIDKSQSRDKELTISNENLQLLVSNFKKNTDADFRSASLNVLHAAGYFEKRDNPLLANAIVSVKNNELDPSTVIDAIRIIGWTNASDHVDLLKSVMENQTNQEVRLAVLDAIAEMIDSNGTDLLVSLWPGMLPGERQKGVGIFLKDDTSRLVLLNAIEQKKIQTSSLSWSNTVSLLNSANHEVRTQARNLLQGNELKANDTWKQYEKALELSGSSEQGLTVFKNNCAVCHQIRGENGTAFGPDLSTMGNRNKPSLLLDILQPNKSIADGYELWTLESTSGTLYSGVISNQSPNTMTIKDAAGKEETLDRHEIKNLKVSEISAMPENLHLQINHQEMADLLAYLKNE